MDYRSAKMRKAEVQHLPAGGLRKQCLALYANGLSYKQIAERVCVPVGTLTRHLAQWRKEERTKDNGN